MDKMSLVSILFVGLPEEIFIVLITVMTAGNTGMLDLKNSMNTRKLLSASALMVLSAYAGRAMLPSLGLNFIIQLAVFYLIILAVYRTRPFALYVGLMIAAGISVLSEILTIFVITDVLYISLPEIYSSDLLRIAASLPSRLVQIVTLIIMYRIKRLNIGSIEVSYDIKIFSGLFIFMLFDAVFLSEFTSRGLISAWYKPFVLIIVWFMVIFLWAIINIIEHKSKLEINKRKRSSEMQAIKQMLSEGKIQQVIEFINIESNINK